MIVPKSSEFFWHFPRGTDPVFSSKQFFHERFIESVYQGAVEGVEKGRENIVILVINSIIFLKGLDVIELEVFVDILRDCLVWRICGQFSTSHHQDLSNGGLLDVKHVLPQDLVIAVQDEV